MTTCAVCHVEIAGPVRGEQFGGPAANFFGCRHVIGQVRTRQEYGPGFGQIEQGNRIRLS